MYESMAADVEGANELLAHVLSETDMVSVSGLHKLVAHVVGIVPDLSIDAPFAPKYAGVSLATIVDLTPLTLDDVLKEEYLTEFGFTSARFVGNVVGALAKLRDGG